MSAAFVADFTDVFDRLATLVDQLFVVVDLNVELERSSDVSAILLVECCLCANLDSHIWRRSPSVSLSDALSWSPPVYSRTIVRPWRLLDVEAFLVFFCRRDCVKRQKTMILTVFTSIRIENKPSI